MTSLTQAQLTQNISSSMHNLHLIINSLALISGAILFWVSLIWILVSLIRYVRAKDKATRRFRFKRPLICFLISVVLTLVPFFTR